MSILIPKLLTIILNSLGLFADLVHNLLHGSEELSPLFMIKISLVLLVINHVIHNLLQDSLWIFLISGHKVYVDLLRSSL